MNYELAKELKESGFMGAIDWVKTPFDDIVPNPTLSELIEACGDNFHSVTRDEYGRGWYASIWEAGGRNDIGEGSTPEEAVAKLWLALNKK